MEEEKPEKNNDLKFFLALIFILAAIIGVVWFFGWRVKQWEIIKQEKPTIKIYE